MIAQAFVDWNTLSFAGAVATGAGTLAVWLNAQFKDTRKQFYNQIKEVYDRIDRFQTSFENKLDYHEKHDDERFQSVTNDIWTVKLLNAAKDKRELETHTN